jgi:hypothetical protein
MRLKAELWVKAYLRQCAGQGVFGVVARRGDEDAGAVYVKINHLDGRVALYGPAPAGLSGADNTRTWTSCLPDVVVQEVDADTYLDRQISFDPDIWIVEIEDRDGRHFLDDWLA